MSEAEGGSCWQRGLDLLERHEILGRVIGVRQRFALWMDNKTSDILCWFADGGRSGMIHIYIWIFFRG